MKDLYAIGYSSYTVDSFIDTLEKYLIQAVVDVRSVPFSKFRPEFNLINIKSILMKNSTYYIPLGDKCGARSTNNKYYINGKVNFKLLSEDKDFKDGLKRIMNSLLKYNIVLMCAEKDPIQCHRTILICRQIKSYNINIHHILADGVLEEHSESELRLLKLFKLDQMHLFMKASDMLEKAYDQQSEKIAYAESGDNNNLHAFEQVQDG